MKPIAFKVRTQGHYDGTKGGKVYSPNTGGGCGALWYFDKTFTVATHADQHIAVPLDLTNNYVYPNHATMKQTPLRYLSVFSGMEAASVAWEPLGFKAVGFSEIEPFPCEILKHRFPNTPNYGDITKHAEWPIEPGTVDILVGGSPCQAFSVAGLRKGLADPRGNLALVFLGLADRLRPEWIVWENVPGVMSSNGGRDLGSFLGALGQLGYGWCYRVLDAQHFGVPQRRRRVFLVAHRSGDPRVAAEVLSLPEGLRGYLAAGGKKRKEASGDTGEGPATDDRGCWWDGGQVSQKGQMMPEKNRFPVVLQPFTASSFGQYAPGVGTVRASGGDLGGGSETLLPEMVPYRKSGRAQSDKDPEFWGLANVSNTLNCFDTGDVRTTHAIVEKRMAVRRLTPVECERLQGFPDNWSRIPWKGKPEEECPDGPRYKACGNSMAVPVMKWIGAQIAKRHA